MVLLIFVIIKLGKIFVKRFFGFNMIMFVFLIVLMILCVVFGCFFLCVFVINIWLIVLWFSVIFDFFIVIELFLNIVCNVNGCFDDG